MSTNQLISMLRRRFTIFEIVLFCFFVLTGLSLMSAARIAGSPHIEWKWLNQYETYSWTMLIVGFIFLTLPFIYAGICHLITNKNK